MDERGPLDDRFMYKDGLSYGLWCLFLFGFAGVHRIYLGKYGTGILWMLTFGLLGIGQLIDLFRMKSLVMDANIREGYLPHPRPRAGYAAMISHLDEHVGRVTALRRGSGRCRWS